LREGQIPPGKEGYVSVLSGGGKGVYTESVCCEGGGVCKTRGIERGEKRREVKHECTGGERPVRQKS